jgi:phosphoglycerol transferase
MTKTQSRRPVGIATAIALTMLMMLGFVCFFAARWFVTVYGRIGFDSIMFTLQSNLSGVQSDLVHSYLLRGLLPALLCTALSFAVVMLMRGLPIRGLVSILCAAALTLGLMGYAAVDVELTDYIWNRLTRSGLYETEYVAPESVQITFPEQKRNLVYIMLESMETTYLSEDLEGGSRVNLIPELTALAQEGINFSHNDTVGGFHATSGASWTIGAIVAQTAGIPLKTPEGIDDWQNGYGKDGIVLPGVTSIQNILDEAGYHTRFLCGSDANLGGRKTYYTTHGTDRIYDIYTAR